MTGARQNGMNTMPEMSVPGIADRNDAAPPER